MGDGEEMKMVVGVVVRGEVRRENFKEAKVVAGLDWSHFE